VPDRDDRLRRLADRAFPARSTVLLEGAPEVPLPREGPLVPVAHDGVDGRHLLAVDAPFPGIAVLSEAWDPGWSATVDREPAKVLIADHALLGVAVGKGAHRVEFRYRPRGLTGAWVAAVAALAVLLAIALPRGPARPAQEPVREPPHRRRGSMPR
jgi:hypothetical protein